MSLDEVINHKADESLKIELQAHYEALPDIVYSCGIKDRKQSVTPTFDGWSNQISLSRQDIIKWIDENCLCLDIRIEDLKQMFYSIAFERKKDYRRTRLHNGVMCDLVDGYEEN